MSRGRKLETFDDYLRSLRNGYGLGSGANYKPWLRVQDVSSKGLSAKIQGIKTQRCHHTLSQNETAFFYLAEYADAVVDIREQFPLLPLEFSNKIANILDIDHPRVPKTKELNVMTTDFVLTKSVHEKIKYEAYCIKPEDALRNERVLEKIELERIWWQLLGVKFKIFTCTELHRTQADNIEWITNPTRYGAKHSQELLVNACSIIPFGLYEKEYIYELLKNEFHLTTDDACALFKTIIFKKLIIVDLNIPFFKSETIEIFNTSFTGMDKKYGN